MASIFETCILALETEKRSNKMMRNHEHMEHHLGIKELKEHDRSREW